MERKMRGMLRGMTLEECEASIQRSLQHPKVQFLREKLEKSGCLIRENFIKAIHCNIRVSGGFEQGRGIFICCNHMNIQDEVDQTVIHELIHAYDECRAKNMNREICEHHACTEIRAGHLSGDCHFKREFLRGYMKIRGHEQDCVKRRVMMSLMVNPSCHPPAIAKDAMEAVWDVCYNDTQPFDKAP